MASRDSVYSFVFDLDSIHGFAVIGMKRHKRAAPKNNISSKTHKEHGAIHSVLFMWFTGQGSGNGEIVEDAIQRNNAGVSKNYHYNGYDQREDESAENRARVISQVFTA